MKKLSVALRWGLAALLGLALCLPAGARAAAAGASLSGPGTVRAGDTITLAFSVSGSGILGGSGTLSFDPSQMTLQSKTSRLSGSWKLEFSGNNFVFYDDSLSSPIHAGTQIFTATFLVNATLKTGAVLSVSVTGIKVSDGSQDFSLGSAAYQKTIAPPLSANANLKSLTVTNAAISPAFNKNTTGYTASVPFSVSKLQISAEAEDGKATVSISGTALAANATTSVIVTVTAENGSTKKYTIRVRRAQDPNYVPSGDNALADLTVSGFLLSPPFDPAVTDYIVWLPFEVESVSVTASAHSPLAKVQVAGGTLLFAGEDNEILIVSTAENGDKVTYRIVAKRAGPHVTPQETPVPSPEPPPTPSPSPTAKPTASPSPAPTAVPAAASSLAQRRDTVYANVALGGNAALLGLMLGYALHAWRRGRPLLRR